MSTLRKHRRIALGAILAFGGAAAVWATPGFMFVSTPLVRATTALRIDLKTHPHELHDVLFQDVVAQPGGYSGWHSHPGYGVVAVKSGIVTMFDGDDPTCTPHVVSAGQVFTEEPGHVHFVRNDGNVPYEATAMFVLPVGAAARTDVPSPGNCPF
jgi:quercetin dioxygenase-like cupin family protein